MITLEGLVIVNHLLKVSTTVLIIALVALVAYHLIAGRKYRV